MIAQQRLRQKLTTALLIQYLINCLLSPGNGCKNNAVIFFMLILPASTQVNKKSGAQAPRL